MPRLLTYALRSLWARGATTLTTSAGIALLVFVLAASGMLASGMRETLRSAAHPSRALVLQHDSWAEQSSRIDQAAFGRVGAAPGIARDADGQLLVAGEVVAHQIMGDIGKGRISTLQVRGIDAKTHAVRPEVHVVLGRPIQPGTAEAIIGRGLVGKHAGLALGGHVELAVGQPIAVVGVFESGGSVLESEIWVELNAARRAFGMEGKLSSVSAVLADPASHEAFALALTEDKQTGLDVEKETAYYEKLSGRISNLIATFGWVEAVIFSLGSIIATMIVLYGSVAQRRHEVGVLRALGFSRASILAAFLAESVALSLGGAAIGVVLALLTPLLDFNTVNFATGQEVAFHFTPDTLVLLGAVGVALAVGVLGGLLPALRAARLDPVVAMRP
jgi:putative ABC transport system permease protein